MKVTTFARASVSASAAAALTLGLTATAFASSTTPTATEEDAVFTNVTAATLVGVGSDTTQDVMYGIAKAINADAGSNVLTTYTATGTGALAYRSGKTATRPVDSGSGYNHLRDAIGITGAGLANANDVDYSRASSQRGAAKTDGSGVITNVPFATDTLGVAVPANSPFLLTNGGAGLTLGDLGGIYDGTKNYINTTTGDLVSVASGTAAPTGTVPVVAFLPKAGSGSRQFFLGQLNLIDAGIVLGSNKGDSLGSTSTPAVAPYVGSKSYGGIDIQEHDATALTTGVPAGVAVLAPFSGAKFIGYHNHVIADPSGKVAGTDYRVLQIKGSSASAYPFNGDQTLAGDLTPNATFATVATQGSAKFSRQVFNVIPTAAVHATSTSSAKLQALKATFVGTSSKVCQKSAVIAQFGFLPLTDTTGANACGDTSRTADDASTATPTVSGSGVAGKTGAVSVAVASNGNGGGRVAITVGGASYTGTIPAGATSTTISVPTPAAGSLPVTGTFTPALPGVRAAQISGAISVQAAPVVKVNGTVKALAPQVKHTKKAKVTVTVTASGTVPTGKVTVVVKKGSKTVVTVKNKALAGGKAAVTLPKKLKKGSYKVYVSYTGDAKVNPVALRSVTTLKVK